MTLELALGPVMLDLDGVEPDQEELELLVNPQVGGVILFSRNYESPAQLTELCKKIHRIRSPRLLIAVDHEGGKVQRFRNGFTELPPAGIFGNIYNKNPQLGLELCQMNAWLMAAELLGLGVDFSFAPVLDLDYGVSEVIGQRALHDTVDGVTDLARAWIRGMHKAGMAAVIKHFPGHGGVKEDSHVEIPVDAREYADIKFKDLVPFARVIESGVEGIMPAHVYYHKVDPENPAGFSKIWLEKILRSELGFKGVIFSDDLSMQGASKIGDYGQRALAALAAGCDMVLVCNHREGVLEVLDVLEQHKVSNVSDMRFIAMHGKPKFMDKELRKSKAYNRTVEKILALEHNLTMTLQV